MNIYEITEGLKRPGKSRSGLAVCLGVDVSQISRLLNGKRQLKVCEVPVIREYLFGESTGFFAGLPYLGRDAAVYPAEAGAKDDDGLSALVDIIELIEEADRHSVDVAATISRALRQAIDEDEALRRRETTSFRSII